MLGVARSRAIARGLAARRGCETGALERPLVANDRLEAGQRHVGRHVDHQRAVVAAETRGHRVVEVHPVQLQLAVVACERLGLAPGQAGEPTEAEVPGAAAEGLGRLVGEHLEAVEVELARVAGEMPGAAWGCSSKAPGVRIGRAGDRATGRRA
jgi:hypothetical protein